MLKQPKNIKNKNLQSKYIINCNELNKKYKDDPRKNMKNALRELNQKRIKNDSIIKNLKKECKEPFSTMYKCPYCSERVNSLTSAHKGKPVSKMIDEILDKHYPESLEYLYKLLRKEHDSTIIVICCNKCNKLLEDK